MTRNGALIAALQRRHATRPAGAEAAPRRMARRRPAADRAVVPEDNRARALVEHAIDIIAMVDRGGLVMTISPAAERSLGWPIEELLGTGFGDIIHPDDRPVVWAAFADVQQRPGPGAPTEFRLRRRDGTWATIESIGSNHLDEPGVDAVIFTSRDVTELRRHQHELAREQEALFQEQRIAREAAEAAVRTRSEFLATMSHEIRTPMNGVIGLTSVLLGTNLDADQRDLTETIRRSGEQLIGLIDDILDLSKIEAGTLDLESVGFSIRDLIGEVLGLLAEPAARRRLRLVSTVAPDVADRVVGDPGRFRQVLVNLVGNAVKFSENGIVEIRTARAAGRSGPTLRVEVADTGIGIRPEVVERLFQPFVQADMSTTRRYGGTGLGLAISRRIVERMGGEIGVVSEAGIGSRFWFTARLGFKRGPRRPRASAPRPMRLAAQANRAPKGRPAAVAAQPAPPAAGPPEPVAAVPPPEPIAAARRPAPGGTAPGGTAPGSLAAGDRRGATILVAEDNPINQKVAARMLEHLGHRVDIAADGSAALQASADRAYDLILMDCQMPDVDGFEATRAIRARERAAGQRRVPIVALTANAMPGDRERCLEAGMDDHIGKPVRPADLARAIARWVALPS